MISIFFFVFCLVEVTSTNVAQGIRGTLQEDLPQLEKVMNTNFAGLILEQSTTATSFHGVNGTLSIFNPIVEINQTSSSIMMIVNRSPNNFNTIIVGWQVYPQMYNDNKTHLFTYWGSDNLEKGCYNLVCPGFVQTDKSITPGQSFNQTSTIDGLTIELPLAIIQDSNSKDWWINIDEKPIGYYPASLFSNMTSADQVAWMGKTTNDVDTPSPPMGSGALPNGVLGHACFFKNISFVDDAYKQQTVKNGMGEIRSSNRGCADAGFYNDNKNELNIQFGGPGGDKCNLV